MDFEEATRENREINRIITERASNNFLYTDYEALDSLPIANKEMYDVIKLKKDTLVYIDFKTKLKIEKDFYFQNNHDDTLRLAFKSPKNFNVFIHDLDTEHSAKENFKSLKKNGRLDKVLVEKINENTEFLSYKIVTDKAKFNGFALCFKSKGYQLFFEFESEKMSKDILKMKAVDFLSQNLKRAN
ncbi:hypothetical protein [Flavobacterium limnophilum]|uniref:hypothetical protein n=1 Tax=Flavobacterium limnophilum TaxID=3003262 RepID=UPI002482DC80|nr:hypothetical protein [Flavobacterium limnophilum]